MNIVIKSSCGEVRVDWADYALLRDNIQHFVEGGKPSQNYRATHSIERAVDEGRALVDGSRLRGELLGACYKLRRIHLQDAAVSLRTRSLVTRCHARPEKRGTARARFTGWRLPTRKQSGSLVRYLNPFISSILSVTRTTVDGDRLSVYVDRASRPPVATQSDAPPILDSKEATAGD